jgi:hypothetical protein
VVCPLPTPACTCTLTASVEPPGLTLSVTSGRVLLGYLLLNANYRHVGTPGLLLTCVGPSPCRNINIGDTPGADDHIRVGYGYIPYQGATSPPLGATGAGYIQTINHAVKPRDLTCP